MIKRSGSGSSDGGSRDNQGGRPPKPEEEKRTESHGLWLSKKEKRELKERAEAAGLSMSTYIRRRALGKPIQPKSDQKTRRELRWIGNNLNQMARAANQGRLEQVESAALARLEELRDAIEHLTNQGDKA